MEVLDTSHISHQHQQHQQIMSSLPMSPMSPLCCTTTTSNAPSLLCEETLDMNELQKTPTSNDIQKQQILEQQSNYTESMPQTVKALHDPSQLNDARVLQNLLRNEHRFSPEVKDYMRNLQSDITPHMRKLVADWMLGVVHEQNSQPEVFCVAMNLLDRFLCHCCIQKSQLQLLGSVCILIGSKIREPCPIPGKTLITYTDYSITAEELKEWELLVLYKLHWELSSITSLDYLDHALPRLGLNGEIIDMSDLRRRTETILVLAATDYQFTYHSPSLLAASAIMTALQSLSIFNQNSSLNMTSNEFVEKQPLLSYHHSSEEHAMSGVNLSREIKLRLQTATHTAMGHIDQCVDALNAILPTYLTGISQQIITLLPPSPDSTTSPNLQKTTNQPMMMLPNLPSSTESEITTSNTILQHHSLDRSIQSPDPDLLCEEHISNDLTQDFQTNFAEDFTSRSSFGNEDSVGASPPYSLGSSTSRSSSPLSAVDIFTEYNTNVLQAIFDQADEIESHFSILVS